MAYTEKVSLSGTALSFLLYECVNSASSQEGFLIGNVSSEVTNHISDSQSDNARLDTQIVIRTVLPLPSVSLFYLPTGRIREDVLSNLLSSTAREVVGWYKYRKNTNIKPTFRDKLIAKGLQKYFEKYHDTKNFVTCNLSNKCSSAGSTHNFTYRFGKINCLDMYEYIEDVTANLGEKLTGYKKAPRIPPNSTLNTFNNIVMESNVQTNCSSDAILCIQEAVDVRLIKEASIAAKHEKTIRELEAEIKQMSSILSDKHYADLQTAYLKISQETKINREEEMAQACVEALSTPLQVDILNARNVPITTNHQSDNEGSVQILDDVKHRSPSPVLIGSNSPKPILNYAAALKTSSEIASTSKANNCIEDLITFDVEDHTKKTWANDDIKCVGDSSPEY